jgi:hypothetical protein
MARVHAIKTGTIRIRPSHRAGNMSLAERITLTD